MALAPSAATAQPPELEQVPLLLPRELRLTPEPFERVCQANPEVVRELKNAAEFTSKQLSMRSGKL